MTHRWQITMTHPINIPERLRPYRAATLSPRWALRMITADLCNRLAELRLQPSTYSDTAEYEKCSNEMNIIEHELDRRAYVAAGGFNVRREFNMCD